MDGAETVAVDAVAVKTSSAVMLKRHISALVSSSPLEAAEAGTAGESDDETWFAYLGFHMVYFLVLVKKSPALLHTRF